MLTVKKPTTKEEFKDYYALRYRVLAEPAGLPKGTEKDDYEPISDHFMAIDESSGDLVGVARIYERTPGVGHLSHLAVAVDRQRQGIGRFLMDFVEQVAREKGFHTIGVMSRLTTTSYFEKFGYKTRGLPTRWFGPTLSIWMEKPLSSDQTS